MITQNIARFYLSQQRGITQEGTCYRSYHTFDFGTYQAPNKEPVGNFTFFNDDTLNEGAYTASFVKQGGALLLLPIVGGLAYKNENSGKISGFAEAGQAAWLSPDEDTTFEIVNPYTSKMVNFLQIGLNLCLPQPSFSITDFDLEIQSNCLFPLRFSGNENKKYTLSSIGKFKGRESGSYIVKNPAAGLFAFVIDGTFEVQDRLLQSRDGLALWDIEEVNFEALSHEAILLLVEMDLKPKAL